MTSNNPPACVLHLLELSAAAWDGDTAAAQQLRFAGELLDLAGGAKALCDVQGMAHDYLLEKRGYKNRDVAGHMGDYWEHIPSWAAL
jgi:hypothetical protein